ncbi:uncharacterized protein LOC116349932 [Contarinia nasturtii]|uniref:uncharacterized protein LOC116349932 n=1 Tax=Contarinia nasturtii TaxID=265458 RepID=UPI0012D3E3A5|nr:uncharacterized protein LOC116349932 [Contarinia nasturtii]
MLNMKPYVPSSAIAVRESYDDDLSDDIEDDVFIRDGKSIKAYEEKGLKRPLMAPRRRNSSKPLLKSSKTRKTMAAIFRKRNRCWKFCEPFCYAFAALLVLFLLFILAIFLMALFPVSLQKFKSLFHNTKLSFALNKVGFDEMAMEELFKGEQTPCTQMSVEKVWSKAFTRLSTESPIRKTDINGDGNADIIMGYSVDDSIQYQSENHGSIPKCEIENGGYREMVPCEGGILALDGTTGTTLWQRWTPSIVFSIFCQTDLNKDQKIDCVVSGRGGLVLALNGENGEVLWHLHPNQKISDIPIPIPSTLVVDLYTINGIRDLDEDSVPDVLAARVEEHRSTDLNIIAGHIVIISGRTGRIIKNFSAPNREELYVPIQVHTQIDGTEYLLVLTGGQNSPGGVYLISLNTIMDHSKENEFITVIRSESSGFMVPAILVDLNEDGGEDIVVSSFNSTVYAFNGQTHATLWKYTFADSESTSSIVPGHYNNDNVTDFMVKYNCGPGFPVYYYSQTQIINGKDGSSLLDQMINDSGGANSLLGGISISQTFGGDLFLHWQTTCRGKYEVKDPYQFIPDSDILLQSRADTCMLRYNASTVLKLYAITRHIQSPGAVIFSTDDLLLQLNQTELKQLEKQMAVSPLKHPKLLKKLLNINDVSTDSEVNSSINSTKPDVNTVMNVTKFIGEERLRPSEIPNKSSAFDKLKNRKKIMENTNKNIAPNQMRINSNNYEKPLFNEQTNEDVQLPLSPNEENAENEIINQRKKQIKNYIINNINRVEGRNQFANELIQEQQQELNNPAGLNNPLEDYQNYYDDNDKRMAMAIANNRDVRDSDVHVDENIPVVEFHDGSYNDSFSSHNRPNDFSDSSEFVSKTRKKDRAETLWDIEMENENADKIIEEAQILSPNTEEDRGRRQLPPDLIQIPNNQNLLAQISSTGVLLKSLNNAPSTLDFVFVLNVRESELYPPLLLAEDMKCLEDKLAVYKDEFTSEYARNNVELVEKQFLKECLIKRMPNLAPHIYQFESQIVVTRISITCACGDLKAGEKCSKFNSIDRQRWTEFMGNLNSGGVYLSD